MSVCVAVAVGKTGLIAVDTRRSVPDPPIGEESPIEATRHPTRTWKHLDQGHKLLPWTTAPCAGFVGCVGASEWSYLLGRELGERAPQTFAEAQLCIPHWSPMLISIALAVGAGPDGLAAIERWERTAGAEGKLSIQSPRVPPDGLSFSLERAGNLTQEEHAPLEARWRARMADVHNVMGLLGAIGQYILDIAERSEFVSRTVDLGYWHTGVGQALQYPAEELVRIGEAGRWTDEDRAAGMERYRTAYAGTWVTDWPGPTS